ncbi:unnamed protein product [Rotaria sp. Silwood2]|nr:unnamed protein product [Rotaria sp. Silwood2]
MSQDNNDQLLPGEHADRLDIYELVYDFQKKNQKDIKQELEEANKTGNHQLIEQKQIQYKNEIEKSRTAAEAVNDGVEEEYQWKKQNGEELQCPSNEPSGDEDGDEDKDQYDMKDVDEVKGDDEEMKTISDQENKLEQMNENRDLNGDDDLDDPNKERIQPITVNRIIFCSRF